MPTTTRITTLFIFVTLSIFMVPQVGIDLYLPALPDMQKALSASQSAIQLSLTFYILTMGFSQLIYGPLSDKYGRRPLILIGSAIFLIGSLIASLAPNVSLLLSGRIFQGVGMGAGFTIASAILGDAFEGAKLARMTTLSSMVYSMSPLLAPVLGGFFTQLMGWRANFYFMVVLAALLLFSLAAYVPETNQHKSQEPLHLGHLILNYLRMLKNISFISYSLCLTMAFGVTITFNVIGPFLLQNVLHVTPVHYGLLLLVLGAAYLIGTSLNSQLLKKCSISSLIWTGLGIMLLSCFGLLFSSFLGWFTPFEITLWTSLLIFGTGFIFPNCFAKALEIFPKNLGSASALIGAFGLVGTSAISAIIAHLHVNTGTFLAFIFIIITAICGFSFIVTTTSTRSV